MKIDDYNLSLIPVEVADLLDKVKELLNFGKYQSPVVSTFPNWVGRLGEKVIYAQSNTWALLVCSSDQTTRWVTMSNFYP